MRLITVPIKVVLVDGLGRMLVRMLVGIVLVLVLLAALWIAMVPKAVPVPVGVRSWSMDLLPLQRLARRCASENGNHASDSSSGGCVEMDFPLVGVVDVHHILLVQHRVHAGIWKWRQLPHR